MADEFRKRKTMIDACQELAELVSHHTNSRGYTEVNERDHPNFSAIVFENGEIQYLNFWIQPSDRVIWWNSPGWKVNLSRRQAEEATGVGVPNYQQQ